MIEEIARVTSVGDGDIQIVTQRPTGCGQCADHRVCSSSVLAKLFSPHQIEMTLTTPLELQPGDRVVIGVPENRFLTSTLVLYGVPLLALIFFGIIGHWLAGKWSMQQEFGSILFGIAGFAGAFYALMRMPFAQAQLSIQPAVLRKAPSSP